MKKAKEDKHIACVKKWTITDTTFTDGSHELEDVLDGFNLLEMLGLVDYINQIYAPRLREKMIEERENL
jgi:hypothetical protein